MYQIQKSTTAGTDLSAEFTTSSKTPECTRCDNSLSEPFTVGIPHRGRIIADLTATAVIVRRTSRSNPKIARRIDTLCLGCALYLGYVTGR